MKRYNLNLQPGSDFTVKEHHWLPRKMNINYFAFGRTLYCRENGSPLPRHEYLHIIQFAHYGTFRVLIHYIYHILRNLIRYRKFSTSFKQVPFEVEARHYESQTEGTAIDG